MLAHFGAISELKVEFAFVVHGMAILAISSQIQPLPNNLMFALGLT